MSPWLRRKPTREENVKATVVALGIGTVIAGVVYYLARLFLGREEVRPLKRGRDGKLEKV